MSDDANIVSMEILDRMRDNAIRLSEDAGLLLEAGSWASATALAIFSIEEFGKFFEIKWGREVGTISKQSRSHARKQSAPFCIYGGVISLAVILELQERLGINKDIHEEPRAFLQFVDYLERHPRYSQIGAMAKKGAVELLARVMADNLGMRAMHRAQRGELEQLKRQSLYFDLSPDGQVISDPGSFQAEAAMEWVKHAKYLSAYTKGEMIDEPVSLHEQTYSKYFEPVLAAVQELMAEMVTNGAVEARSTTPPQGNT
jgi:AbiV family abortive infection protein